jgi:hypothetical protein
MGNAVKFKQCEGAVNSLFTALFLCKARFLQPAALNDGVDRYFLNCQATDKKNILAPCRWDIEKKLPLLITYCYRPAMITLGKSPL